MDKFCQYCGWNMSNETHDVNQCKRRYKPIYLNQYQIGNLIGLFALTKDKGLHNGDWAGEIPIKLQQWCKKNGLPISNNFCQKIDSTTWSESWSIWLDNILKSNDSWSIK